METIYQTTIHAKPHINLNGRGNVEKYSIGKNNYIVINKCQWFDIKNKNSVIIPSIDQPIIKWDDDWTRLEHPHHCVIYKNKLFIGSGKIYDENLNMINESKLNMKWINNKYVISTDENTTTIYIFDIDELELINKINGKIYQIYGDNILFNLGEYKFKCIYNIPTNTITDLDHNCVVMIDDLIICSTDLGQNSTKKPVEFKKLKINGCELCSKPLDETYAFVPCGHTKVCNECYKLKIIVKCPTCNKKIDSRIQVHI
jgi:hypothetical protein